MDKNMVSSNFEKKLFFTGCDSKTSWMLPWFKDNFRKHNPDAELMIMNFDDMFFDHTGWFKKPAAMMFASSLAEKVCWLDTDCEVRGNLDPIFSRIEPNKLSMVEDVPWSKRRQETWHNSGVVAFQGIPIILKKWADEVKRAPVVGDQEVLHSMLRVGMNRLMHIEDLPRQYNTLRIDLIDKSEPKNIKILHWTGAKGKEEIKRQMND